MSESDLYKELGKLTKDRDRWEENVPYVSSLLSYESEKIQAKALWLLAEMGLTYPQSVRDVVPIIASFCNNPVPLLRERAINALGRIGRSDYRLIEPYWTDLFRFADDETAQVRLSFIWASENIATNTPDIYERYMPVFENERGTYIFNSKDLCMIGHIPELISAGIDSLKIEGRMKTALYVATVARTYRKAIDDYLKQFKA